MSTVQYSGKGDEGQSENGESRIFTNLFIYVFLFMSRTLYNTELLMYVESLFNYQKI